MSAGAGLRPSIYGKLEFFPKLDDHPFRSLFFNYSTKIMAGKSRLEGMTIYLFFNIDVFNKI